MFVTDVKCSSIKTYCNALNDNWLENFNKKKTTNISQSKKDFERKE